jgi:hypothetical protein
VSGTYGSGVYGSGTYAALTDPPAPHRAVEGAGGLTGQQDGKANVTGATAGTGGATGTVGD